MENAPQAEIDFSAYRKPELVEKIAALISVPRTLATIATCGLLMLMILGCVLFWGFGDRVAQQWHLGLYAYGAIASVGLGILTGMALALNRGLANLIQVLDMSLEISQQATRDLAAVKDGKAKRPNVQQVISGVYEQVILVTLETVVMAQSKWLGGIILPIYRWTLGRLVRLLLKRFAAEEKESPDEITIAEVAEPAEPAEPSQALAEDEAATEHAIRWLTHARTYLSQCGDGFRRIVMVPVTVLLVLCGLVSVIPIAVAWWFW